MLDKMSGQFDIARQFSERSFEFMNKDELANGLESCAQELGFPYFAVLHHVDLRKNYGVLIHIDNYPESWSERFINSCLFLDDPVLHASLTTNLGFSWECLPKLIQLKSRHYRILDAARREGLHSGFTVPANIPGEAHGSCSFACSVASAFPSDCLLAAQLVGSFAFQAARRICCSGRPLCSRAAHLTPRQQDCLELVAQGKTDWEIGKILGLKEDSVTKVINAARRRYDVANRTELVVAALFDGQISFNEIRHWQYDSGLRAIRLAKS